MDEQMAAWMKYAQPSERHEFLTKMAGTWNAKATFWMQPGAPPTESEGTMVNEMILGGRFLQSRYDANFMGSPFQGMAIDGYDILKVKFVGVWLDTMSTMMLQFEGDCDDAGEVRTMVAHYTDAMTGNPAQMKGATTIIGEDEHRYEAWQTGPDGNLHKSMEIVYTRST